MPDYFQHSFENHSSLDNNNNILLPLHVKLSFYPENELFKCFQSICFPSLAFLPRWQTYRYLPSLTWWQHPADHSWHDQGKERQDFNVTSQQAASLSMRQTLGSKSSLNNNLARQKKNNNTKQNEWIPWNKLDLCDFCSTPCLIHALAYMTELRCMTLYRKLAEHKTSIRADQGIPKATLASRVLS